MSTLVTASYPENSNIFDAAGSISRHQADHELMGTVTFAPDPVTGVNTFMVGGEYIDLSPQKFPAKNIGLLLSMVDDIASRGGVLVFYFHTIAAIVDGVNPTAEDLATLVSYVKSKQDAGLLQCIKLSELRKIYDSTANRV